MSNAYHDLEETSNKLTLLRSAIPDVMEQIDALALVTTQDSALSKKSKELIALSLSVFVRSKHCSIWHIQTLVKLGVTREELLEALSIVIYLGGGLTTIAAAQALAAFDALNQ